MSEIVKAIANSALLVFVVGSMLGAGLLLTVREILQPLRNARLVALALVANFILVPLLAWLILLAIPLDRPLRVGLILLSTAGGAPFLPVLARIAKGNVAFSVGLMIVLMVVTVIYMPVVLPLLLPGTAVSPWEIAKNLILLMLLPLGIGLLIRARSEAVAEILRKIADNATRYSMIVVLALILTVHFKNILSVIGSGAILAGAIFMVGAFLLGYLLGGPGNDTKRVLGLATGQRNIAAAMLVASRNFSEPMVIVMLLIVTLLGLFIQLPVAIKLGTRRHTP
ncbi:MAG: bile acid:sodium symporter [Chlamydiota bacterium]